MGLQYLLSYYLEHGCVDVLKGSCLYGLFLYLRKELSIYKYGDLRGLGCSLQILMDWDDTLFSYISNVVDDFSVQVIVANNIMCYIDVHGEGRMVDDFLYTDVFTLGMCKITTKKDGEYVRMIRDCLCGTRRFFYFPVKDEVIVRCCLSLEYVHHDRQRLNI